MNTLGDQIALDPQFAVELPKNKSLVLSTLLRVNNPRYKITHVDDRVFIAISEKEEEWWLPELQLEVNRIDESRSMLSGWIAPRSLLWNALLGLQLLAGSVFIGCAIWTYLNWTAGTAITLPLILAIAMIPAWITLYFVRRSGKSKGRPFIYGFYEFLNNRVLLN